MDERNFKMNRNEFGEIILEVSLNLSDGLKEKINITYRDLRNVFSKNGDNYFSGLVDGKTDYTFLMINHIVSFTVDIELFDLAVKEFEDKFKVDVPVKKK